MNKNKKGVSISINTIVITAIALLVLIILAVLVARSAGQAGDGTSCVAKGGICKETCGNLDPIVGVDCPEATHTCCNPISRFQ